MTDLLRKTIAVRFRALLDMGVLRKNAIVQVEKEHKTDRRSIYRYCKRFGVSTR